MAYFIKSTVGNDKEQISPYNMNKYDAIKDALETAKSLVNYASFEISVWNYNEYSSNDLILEIKGTGE